MLSARGTSERRQWRALLRPRVKRTLRVTANLNHSTVYSEGGESCRIGIQEHSRRHDIQGSDSFAVAGYGIDYSKRSATEFIRSPKVYWDSSLWTTKSRAGGGQRSYRVYGRRRKCRKMNIKTFLTPETPGNSTNQNY